MTTRSYAPAALDWRVATQVLRPSIEIGGGFAGFCGEENSADPLMLTVTTGIMGTALEIWTKKSAGALLVHVEFPVIVAFAGAELPPPPPQPATQTRPRARRLDIT